MCEGVLEKCLRCFSHNFQVHCVPANGAGAAEDVDGVRAQDRDRDQMQTTIQTHSRSETLRLEGDGWAILGIDSSNSG